MKIHRVVIEIICIWLVVILFAGGCADRFDASEYTKAVLGLSFQGDTKRASEVMEEASKEELEDQYRTFIDTFVQNNITNELDMGELKQMQFSELIAKIFSTMRYHVGEAEKTGKSEYKVPVEIQPSDVFLRYQQMITMDALAIAEKVREGAYKGTDEEVTAQVLKDIANHAYELLDAARIDASYGDKVTVNITVKANQQNMYYIEDESMDRFVVKILRLDEIHD